LTHDFCTVAENAEKLDNVEQTIRNNVCETIIQMWPHSVVDEKKAEAQWYGLTDETTFWYKILQTVFKTKLSVWLNANHTLVRPIVDGVKHKCRTHKSTGE
jgi:hypothetical protein